MSTTDLTAQTFEQTVLDHDIVFVDLWASWCGPCLRFGPVYDKASAANTDIVFGKVDTEAEQALAAALDISSIPTLMAFREGILVFRQAGALPPETLATLIDQVRALDMQQVREQVATAKEEAASEQPAGAGATTA